MRTKNRRVSRWLTVGVSCLALCLSINGMAQAALITFSFEGLVGSASSPLNSTIAPNTSTRDRIRSNPLLPIHRRSTTIRSGVMLSVTFQLVS